MTVICNYCGKPAEYIGGSDLYPHRPDLFSKRFWRCYDCDAYVGCIGGTNKPHGILANKSLRSKRMQAHSRFDMLWKNGIMSRSDAYAWLSNKLGIPKDECHIGQFDSLMCNKVIKVMDSYAISQRV